MTAFASKAAIEGALVAQELASGWDEDIVLAGFEIAEDKPDDWRLDAYLPRRPNAADRRALDRLFIGKAPKFRSERLPAADWVTESQKGIDPIRAGRFYVRTPEHPADPRAVDLVIPASQAFRTGQHGTAAGCLYMPERIPPQGPAFLPGAAAPVEDRPPSPRPSPSPLGLRRRQRQGRPRQRGS